MVAYAQSPTVATLQRVVTVTEAHQAAVATAAMPVPLAPLPPGLVIELVEPPPRPVRGAKRMCSKGCLRQAHGRFALCRECLQTRGGPACVTCGFPAGRAKPRRGQCDTCYTRERMKRKRASANAEAEEEESSVL